MFYEVYILIKKWKQNFNYRFITFLFYFDETNTFIPIITVHA